jgi:manganese efflux pump family protein
MTTSLRTNSPLFAHRRVLGTIAGSLMGAAVVVSALAFLPALASQALPLVGATAVKTAGIALAVGLDVVALSTGIGVLGLPGRARFRIGASFAFAEVAMQLLGAAIGAGFGRLAGEIAAYAGFAVLAFIGVWIFRESFDDHSDSVKKATSGVGLLLASATVSLDSLGVGFSLPALNVPLVPLLLTVAVTTVAFTFAGLRFGEILGRHFHQRAERAAGIVLIVLAVLFTLQHRA